MEGCAKKMTMVIKLTNVSRFKQVPEVVKKDPAKKEQAPCLLFVLNCVLLLY
jgi:hypothetical protein